MNFFLSKTGFYSETRILLNDAQMYEKIDILTLFPDFYVVINKLRKNRKLLNKTERYLNYVKCNSLNSFSHFFIYSSNIKKENAVFLEIISLFIFRIGQALLFW